jgi:hypothetical protein
MLLTAAAVKRVAGAVVAPASAARVLIATGMTVFAGRHLSPSGAIETIGCAAGLGFMYLIVLAVSRELGGSDMALLARIAGRKGR